jgi:hypothetical protein
MINKGDTLLFKSKDDEKDGEDVGVVVRVHAVPRETVYIVHNGYGEAEVAPREVLEVLKAVPRRRRSAFSVVARAAGAGSS